MSKVVENKPEVPEHEESDREGQVVEDSLESSKKKSFAGDKPEFKRPMLCEITEATFQTDNKVVTEDRGKDLPKDKQYKKHWLRCRFKYTDAKTKEEMFFEQSYGSIREYESRLWTGTANNLSELKNLFEAFQSVPMENIWELSRELVGKKCMVKSVPWEFGSNKGFANKVQDFVEEE